MDAQYLVFLLNCAQRAGDNTRSLRANSEKELGKVEVCISGKIFHQLLPMPFDRVNNPKIASYLVRICSLVFYNLEQRLGGNTQFLSLRNLILRDLLKTVTKNESVTLKTRGIPLQFEIQYRCQGLASAVSLSLKNVLRDLFAEFLEGFNTYRAMIARNATPTEAP